MIATTNAQRWVTWGDVRGMGEIRDTRQEADRDLMEDRTTCYAQGGYSDRAVYQVDADGYLFREVGGEGAYVWPSSGRSTGAVRVPR